MPSASSGVPVLLLVGVVALALTACRASAAPPRGESTAVVPREGPAPRMASPENAASRAALEPVAPAALCVEAGKIAGAARSMHVDVGGMRAVLAGDHSRAARLAFTYRGPSPKPEPLADGEVRRQIGLKLRAQDTCNIVYVMWHAEPSRGIFVSVKRNPGQSTHAQCADRGYRLLTPTAGVAAPLLTVGTPHTLQAELRDRRLVVTADGTEVWDGELPDEAFAFDGPAGLRSDNGIFDFELAVPSGVDARGACPAGPR